MPNARTNSLMDTLDVETRRAVERDLVEQPPGRASYAEVYAFHGLAERGISLKALERYGGYLRTLARNKWIGDLADVTVGRDLAPEIAGMIRARLFESLTSGECSLGDLLKASITEKSLRESQIKTEQWEAKRRAALDAVETAEKIVDPDEARRKMAAEIRAIYGLGGDAAV